MERMKMKFIIAVTERLSAAAESGAKVELIEELSDNLYSRWQDLISNGMDEEEAYRQALDELGDVDELLAYLASLGPDGELPKQDSSFRDFTSELLHGVEGIVRETVNQTKDAVDQATVIVRNVAEKMKEKYPEGFKGRVYVHFDGDETSKATVDVEADEDVCVCREQPGEGAEDPNKGWSFAVGYNRERGGFFCEGTHPSSSQRVSGTVFPSKNLKNVDIQLVNGDVAIHLDSDPDADVQLDGDVDKLEVRVNDNGSLSIRQGNTASSMFFFHRGLARADVELTLPQRFWDLLQISVTNGDVEIDNGLEAGKLTIKTISGDASFEGAKCSEASFKSASGDLDCEMAAGEVYAESASGDLTLAGAFGTVRAGTASGDVDLSGNVRTLRCTSASGSVEVRTDVVPDEMNISSKSGDCEVTMPGGQGFTLQFSTVSGELDTDFPLVGPAGSRSGEAIYLDGGGRNFRISSISGDISLRQM